MKTAVAPTSITAYRKNADILSESREIVAREILKLTRAGQPAWISRVTCIMKAEHPNTDKSSVSGRFNDLAVKFPDGFMLDGKRYRMELLKNRVFDPASGKTGQFVQAWALVLYQSPEGGGEQTKLF